MLDHAGFDRNRALHQLAHQSFDVLVVGGGITGCGVALDAASRGLRTALIERDDFASGTSSKSSKMVHGGLRYLQQGDVRLVYEALAERQRLRRNAPHLVGLLPFLLPIFSKDGLISKELARAMGSAMWMYDLTGGARIGRVHKRLTADEAHAHMSSLARHKLAGGYLYFDARADDARLTLTLARTAALNHGAVVVNRCSLTGLDRDSRGSIRSASVRTTDGNEFSISTSCVVNATGVWADNTRAIDEGAHPAMIRPAKGVHVTVPLERVGCDIAVVIPVRGDKRSIFVVPWGDLAYIGTTDTDFDGSINEPTVTEDDIAYLLGAVNGWITDKIAPDEILGTWAGLRPLVSEASSSRTADLSRRHHVAASTSGMLTVTGGKLTTYRQMSEDAVDEALQILGLGRRRCRTHNLMLIGADGLPTGTADDTDHLTGRYGTQAGVIKAMIDADPSLGAPLVEGLPYLRAEAVYGARHEMATTIDDVLERRTRALLLREGPSREAATDVAALIGPELGWDDAEQARQVATFLDRPTTVPGAAHVINA